MAGEPKTLDRIIIHDINNKLQSMMFVDQVLADPRFAEQLDEKTYSDLTKWMNSVKKSGLSIRDQIATLGNLNRTDSSVTYVDASSLESDHVEYTVVHVDDEEYARGALNFTLTKKSNLNPLQEGTFGHDARPIKYNLHSYSSVDEALKELPTLGRVDLLITDREMPQIDGYGLLGTIQQQENKQVRRPEFNYIGKIAMLTGGLSKEEAQRINSTYGIEVLSKPFIPLSLEGQIYRIINTQS